MTIQSFLITYVCYLTLTAAGLFFYARWGWKQMIYADNTIRREQGRCAVDFVSTATAYAIVALIVLAWWSLTWVD